MRDKRALIIGGIVLFLGFAYWLIKDATKPLPGEGFADLGRTHITDISDVEYNSNPPTSGSHFPVWAKKGVYDRVISDGYLIHSLEHGYIVISYNCGQPDSPLTPVTEATPSGQASPSADPQSKPMTKMQNPSNGQSFWTPQDPPRPEVTLQVGFQTDNCKRFAEGVSKLLDTADRVILVPRPNMDTTLILTAWTRMLKLNPSLEFGMNDDEKKQATDFIRTLHNKGPEKTME